MLYPRKVNAVFATRFFSPFSISSVAAHLQRGGQLVGIELEGPIEYEKLFHALGIAHVLHDGVDALGEKIVTGTVDKAVGIRLDLALELGRLLLQLLEVRHDESAHE